MVWVKKHSTAIYFYRGAFLKMDPEASNSLKSVMRGNIKDTKIQNKNNILSKTLMEKHDFYWRIYFRFWAV